jgi:hypothetical protein
MDKERRITSALGDIPEEPVQPVAIDSQEDELPPGDVQQVPPMPPTRA